MMSSPPSTTARVSVVLRAPENWKEWMLVVNIMAHRGGVMDLIDVNAAELSKPICSTLPMYSAVKPAATSIKDLDANEQKDLIILRENYWEVLREYIDKTDTLKAIKQYIMASVNRQLILYLNDTDTVHQKLLILKKRMVLTDRVRKINVVHCYQDLYCPLLKGQTEK